MSLHLKRRDYYAIAAFLIISVISGFLMELVEGEALISLHDATFYIPGPALIIGLTFIHFAREKYGGVIARNLEVVGAGIGLLAVFWVAYAGFFAAGFPAWGVTPAFWTTFLSTAIVTTFLVTGYGFYLFWKLGSEAAIGGEES
jgi:hypothetical protein